MKYRNFGSTGWKVSALGFGTKYLPLRDIKYNDIKVEELAKLLSLGIAKGINYFDLGSLEQMKIMAPVLKKVFNENNLEKVRMSARLPLHFLHSPQDFDHYLDEQLSVLQVNKLDFYLIIGLHWANSSEIQEIGILPWAEAAMADGRIKNLGFSFYHDFQSYKAIINSYDNWTFCQLQYDYVKEDLGPGSVGLQHAMEKGLAVVISEPLMGGYLTREPPGPVSDILEMASSKQKLVNWALRWVWNRQEVSTVVVDMNTRVQLLENINITDSSEPNCLTVEELVLYREAKDTFKHLRPIPCAYCRTCMPCPNGIDVPRIFEVYNDAALYSDTVKARAIYRNRERFVLPYDYGNCNHCNTCVKKCPRGINIKDWLKISHELLS